MLVEKFGQSLFALQVLREYTFDYGLHLDINTKKILVLFIFVIYSLYFLTFNLWKRIQLEGHAQRQLEVRSSHVVDAVISSEETK